MKKGHHAPTVQYATDLQMKRDKKTGWDFFGYVV